MKVLEEVIYLLGDKIGPDSLAFKTGEVVQALVKDVTQKEAVLLLRGHLLRARTEIPLRPGEPVKLQVREQTGDGQIILRILDQGTGDSGLTETDPKQLLKSLGMIVNSQNIRLAEELIRQRVQPTEETLRFLSQSLQGEKVAPWEVAALVRLWSQGLPVKTGNITALAALFKAFEDSQDTRVNLFKAISGAGQDEMPSDFGSLLSRLSFSPEEDAEVIRGKLVNLPKFLGLSYEAGLRKEDDIDTLSGSSLKAVLIALVNQSLGTGQAEMKRETHNLLRVLTGLQLFNAVRQGDNSFHLYLMGWLSLSQEQTPFFLSLKKLRGERGVVNEETVQQVLLQTSTPRLGDLLAELRIHGRFLSCGFTVETVESQQVINEHRQRLVETLENLSREVQVFPCRISIKQRVQEMWLQQLTGIKRNRRLDVKA